MGIICKSAFIIQESESSSKFLAILQGVKHPRKRLYRARAHSNPLNDANFDVPAYPAQYDWYADPGREGGTVSTESVRIPGPCHAES